VPCRKGGVYFAQRHLHRDGFCRLINEPAVDRSQIRVSDRSIKIPFLRAVNERLSAGRIGRGLVEEAIAPV
jgi:hypothetical protein